MLHTRLATYTHKIGIKETIKYLVRATITSPRQPVSNQEEPGVDGLPGDATEGPAVAQRMFKRQMSRSTSMSVRTGRAYTPGGPSTIQSDFKRIFMSEILLLQLAKVQRRQLRKLQSDPLKVFLGKRKAFHTTKKGYCFLGVLFVFTWAWTFATCTVSALFTLLFMAIEELEILEEWTNSLSLSIMLWIFVMHPAGIIIRHHLLCIPRSMGRVIRHEKARLGDMLQMERLPSMAMVHRHLVGRLLRREHICEAAMAKQPDTARVLALADETTLPDEVLHDLQLVALDNGEGAAEYRDTKSSTLRPRNAGHEAVDIVL